VAARGVAGRGEKRRPCTASASCGGRILAVGGGAERERRALGHILLYHHHVHLSLLLGVLVELPKCHLEVVVGRGGLPLLLAL
jgi:hypothetical protein